MMNQCAHRLGCAVAVCAAMVAAAQPAQAQNRTLTGSGNNVANPDWGAAGARLVRVAGAAYADGVSAPARAGLPSARAVSNAIFHQDTAGGVIIPDPRGLTDYAWAWGQFLDHDIDLTPGAKGESAPIAVPTGDLWFDPQGLGGASLPFTRSLADPATGTGPGDPRQQVNVITAFIDASNVYGSDAARAQFLRAGVGGRLAWIDMPGAGAMPPFNDGTVPNAPSMSAAMHVAGDVRANETTTLLALHTLFLREHNRLAGEIAAANPSWTDEEVYQRARKLVGALIQWITYNEFLPALVGAPAVAPYSGYDPGVDPGIANEFSTAAYRLGHSLLSPMILRLDAAGQVIPEGNLPMARSFFNPPALTDEGGLAPIFRGLAAGRAQRVDTKVNDDIRVRLFEGVEGGPPMDLAALNIQRGRDHGLPDYNTIRQAYGLAPVTAFDEISSDPAVVSALQSVYPDVGAIDPWVGMLAEDLAPGASVGETVRAILVDQFTRLRDGDRFWYRNDPALAGDVDWIESNLLSDVIIRNTSVQAGEIQERVFFAACPSDLTADLVVDLADVSAILLDWNTSSPAADLNGDGIVNGVDITFVLNNFGSCLD